LVEKVEFIKSAIGHVTYEYIKVEINFYSEFSNLVSVY